MSRPWRKLASLLSGVLVWTSAACEAPRLGAAKQAQWYHLELITEAGDAIPFFLKLPEDCQTEPASIVNGDETLEAPCRRSDESFRIDFPVYGTEMSARIEPGGMVTGRWAGESSWQQNLRVQGRPIAEPTPRSRFPMESRGTEPLPPPVDFSGTWRMTFELHGIAKGVFSQKPSGVITGTVEVPSVYGDLRFLAGNVWGDRMYVSSFDGGHAFLLHGRLSPEGNFEGEWVLGGRGWDPFVAERDQSFSIPDPLDRVRSDGELRVDLGPLRTPKYAGKAVIIEIFGTWCPNCNDLAPLLAELYREHHADGLEILGLAFEYGDDEEYKERRVEAFERKYGISWDIVIMDVALEDLDGEFAGLEPIEGVPVTIFLNRDRTVHAVYTGFSGPATGDAHQKARAVFRTLIAEIVSGR